MTKFSASIAIDFEPVSPPSFPKAIAIAVEHMTEVFDWLRENGLTVRWKHQDHISVCVGGSGGSRQTRFGRILAFADDKTLAAIMLAWSHAVAWADDRPAYGDRYLFNFGQTAQPKTNPRKRPRVASQKDK